MGLFRTCYLLSLIVTTIKCAPTDPLSPFYTAILERCPTLITSPNQPLFKTCSNWEKINKTPVLSAETRTDVLCLLYFESFTQYCNQSQEVNTTIPTTFKVDINTICDNLDIIPNQTRPESLLRKIIATKKDCENLCSDPFEGVMSVCTKSYYYSHYLESVKPKDHMVTVKENPSHFMSVKPEPKFSEEHIKKAPESPAKLDQDTQTDHEITKDSKIQTKVEAIPDKTSEKGHSSVMDSVHQSGQIAGDTLSKTLEPNSSGAIKPDNNQVAKGDAPKFKGEPEDNPKPEENPKPEVNPIPEEKSKTEEKKVENQLKPDMSLTSPPNDETINVDNNPNAQVDKNPGGDNDDFVNEDINPPNNDHLESEEELEEQPNQLGDKSPKPKELDETDEAVNYTSEMDGDSYFFTYFMLLCVIFIVGYVCYHNKQKILALILEGRRGKRQYRGRRPNSANYHKLDSNLEEAITSSCNKNTNNVIY